jgi:hypothetical protein
MPDAMATQRQALSWPTTRGASGQARSCLEGPYPLVALAEHHAENAGRGSCLAVAPAVRAGMPRSWMVL